MAGKPPWDHVERWRDARREILEILDEAVRIRDGVVDALKHPHDGAASCGFVFYMRWRGTLRDLSKTHPHIEVVHFKRAVFSLFGVPLRLYRADADDEPPARVLDISKQERKAIQMAWWEDSDEPGDEEQPEPDVRFRLRTVPDEEHRIAEFVFEELDDAGDVSWEYSIRPEDIPAVLAVIAPIREPVKQPPPPVGAKRNAQDKSSDDEG